jgi:hypothetical protein
MAYGRCGHGLYSHAEIRLDDGNLANALFRASLLGSTPQPEFLAFHGEAGSVVMRGEQAAADDHIQRLMAGQQEWGGNANFASDYGWPLRGGEFFAALLESILSRVFGRCERRRL